MFYNKIWFTQSQTYVNCTLYSKGPCAMPRRWVGTAGSQPDGQEVGWRPSWPRVAGPAQVASRQDDLFPTPLRMATPLNHCFASVTKQATPIFVGSFYQFLLAIVLSRLPYTSGKSSNILASLTQSLT